MSTETWINNQVGRFIALPGSAQDDQDYVEVLAARQDQALWTAYVRATSFLVAQALMVVSESALLEHGELMIDGNGLALVISDGDTPRSWVASPPSIDLVPLVIHADVNAIVTQVEAASGTRSFSSEREHFEHILSIMEAEWPHARTLRTQSEACWAIMHEDLHNHLIDLINQHFTQDQVTVIHDPEGASVPRWFETFIEQRVRLHWFSPISATLSIGLLTRKVRLTPDRVLPLLGQDPITTGAGLIGALGINRD